ncbi:MAG: RND family transporter [Firmicutes bacterium]|nr:RND family transporter [Bacillota bacterium]
MDGLGRFAIRHPVWLLTLSILLTLLLVAGIPRLALTSSVEELVPSNSPAKQLLEEVQKQFGGTNMVVLAVQGDIYTPASFERLRRLTQAIQAMPDVERVLSVANVSRLESQDMMLNVSPVLADGPVQPAEVQAARAYVASNPLYRGRLVSGDGHYAAVIVDLSPSAPTLSATAALRDAGRKYWGSGVVLAGLPYLNAEVIRILNETIPRETALAALIIAFVLFLNFRSARGVALPMLSVLLALGWSLGLAGWLGFKLGMISSALPVVVLAVGNSYALHILNRYYHELAVGEAKEKAILLAMGQTGVGVLISALAASAGFLALMTSQIPQIREFGLLTALGIVVAFFAAVLVVPAILALLGTARPALDLERPDGIHRRMERLSTWVERHRQAILAVSAALLLVLAWGATHGTVETSVSAYFPKNGQVRRGIDRVDQVFGGSQTINVVVDGDLKNPRLLRSLQAFSRQAGKLEGVGSVVSVADVVEQIHHALTGHWALPTQRDAVGQELMLFQMSADPQDLKQFMDEGATKANVVVQVKDMPSRQMGRLLDQVQRLADGLIAPQAQRVQVTGSAVLLNELTSMVTHDQLVSLGLALSLVFVFNALLLGSAWLGLMGIIPLILTIAGQFGLMGLAGIPLDVATALIAAVAIGVGDYTIHVIVRYREERRDGASDSNALRTALAVSGRAVLFNSLSIASGFAALFWSGFVPIRTFGGLMDFTVLATAAGALVVMPAVLLSRPLPVGATPSEASSPEGSRAEKTAVAEGRRP